MGHDPRRLLPGNCKESDARSLRGGGGELGYLINLNLWLHYFCTKIN
jgi:hypothetical protein